MRIRHLKDLPFCGAAFLKFVNFKGITCVEPLGGAYAKNTKEARESAIRAAIWYRHVIHHLESFKTGYAPCYTKVLAFVGKTPEWKDTSKSIKVKIPNICIHCEKDKAEWEAKRKPKMKISNAASVRYEIRIQDESGKPERVLAENLTIDQALEAFISCKSRISKWGSNMARIVRVVEEEIQREEAK